MTAFIQPAFKTHRPTSSDVLTLSCCVQITVETAPAEDDVSPGRMGELETTGLQMSVDVVEENHEDSELLCMDVDTSLSFTASQVGRFCLLLLLSH